LALNYVQIEEFQNVQIIEMSKQHDSRGSLAFVEMLQICGFSAKRLFLLENFTDNAVRGNHAHKSCQQVIFVLRGQAEIEIDNGRYFSRITLKNNNYFMNVKAMTWVKIENVSEDSLILVAASDEYDESDYIRSRQDFEAMVNATP